MTKQFNQSNTRGYTDAELARANQLIAAWDRENPAPETWPDDECHKGGRDRACERILRGVGVGEASAYRLTHSAPRSSALRAGLTCPTCEAFNVTVVIGQREWCYRCGEELLCCLHCSLPVAEDEQDADSREPLHCECATAYAAERAQEQADNRAEMERERNYAANAADADSDTAESEGGKP
jgi:hypothetical protein